MKNTQIKVAFLLGLFALIFQSAAMPSLQFMAFGPFLVLAIVYSSFVQALWLGCLSGTIIDLFSSTHMGSYALCYTLTVALLYKQKRNFIDEKPLNLALFTAVISLTSTILLTLLLFVFDRSSAFSGKWAFLDAWVMCFFDAIYALVWFYCPFILYKAAKRQIRIWKIRYKRRHQ